jgi:hypothetical protein
MDVCVVLYKDSSMKDKKGLHSTKNGSKRKTPGINTKKNPTGGMDVCVVFVVRTVAWNVK